MKVLDDEDSFEFTVFRRDPTPIRCEAARATYLTGSVDLVAGQTRTVSLADPTVEPATFTFTLPAAWNSGSHSVWYEFTYERESLTAAIPRPVPREPFSGCRRVRK